MQALRRQVFGRDARDARRALDGRVAVVSPHLDDAVLSLGASIAAASAAGSRVRVVTVLCNDPKSDTPAAEWDAVCGFETEGAAARGRRVEDAAACAAVGAEPVWLAFRDMEYEASADREAVRAAVVAELEDADVVLIPGWPLVQPDHRWLVELLLEDELPGVLGVYTEQPYAALQLLGRGGRTWAGDLTLRGSVANLGRLAARPDATARPRTVDLTAELVEPADWFPLAVGSGDRSAKRQALQAYVSQLRGFGPLVLERVAWCERAWGGEGLAWAR